MNKTKNLSSIYKVEITNLETGKRIKFKTKKQKNIIQNLKNGDYKVKYRISITKKNGHKVTESKWSKYSYFTVKYEKN